jgi:hypothetical protein
MSYGSYYQSEPNYYQNPVPYTSSDIGEPVPGWGTSVRVAGPQNVGVGALGLLIPGGDKPKVASPLYSPELAVKAAQILMAPTTTSALDDQQPAPATPPPPPPPVTSGEPLPWWIWPAAAAVVLGGVGYIGTKKGWF